MTSVKTGYRPNEISKREDLFISLAFMMYTIACVIPLVLVFIVSISSENSVLLNGYRFIPETFSFAAYEYLFTYWEQVARSYGISIFVTVVGTALGVTLMALYAYPISRKDLPHRRFFSFFIFFTMLFNGGLVPFYLTYVQLLDLKNSIWALVLPLLLSPFFVLIMRTFFRENIPMEVLESAKMDGASEFKIFYQIVLPLSLPVLASTALFSTLGYWNDWFLSLIFITTDENVNLQYLMYRTMRNIQYINSNTSVSQALSAAGASLKLPSQTFRMAMCIVGIGPIVFAYPFFQKYFIRGLTVGAVKG
jgi:putative aldouronate transport system permease protein